LYSFPLNVTVALSGILSASPNGSEISVHEYDNWSPLVPTINRPELFGCPRQEIDTEVSAPSVNTPVVGFFVPVPLYAIVAVCGRLVTILRHH